MENYVAGSTSYLEAKSSTNKSYRINKCTINQKLNNNFTINASVVTDGEDLDDLLGDSLTISWFQDIAGRANELLNYHGYVTEITEVDTDADSIRSFNLIIKPWLWLLTLNRCNRIYQAKSVKDILTDIFDSAGFKGQYKFGTMPTIQREYCTQYNETDFAFALRVMAEAGVIFYFVQEGGKHTLQIQSAEASFTKNTQATFDHAMVKDSNNLLLSTWRKKQRSTRKSLSLSGYNSDKVKTEQASSQLTNSAVSTYSNKHFEFHGQPTDKGDFSDVATLAKQLIASEESRAQDIEATTDSNLVLIGQTLTLAKHQNADFHGDYNVIGLKHVINVTSSATQATYKCTISCRKNTLSVAPQMPVKPKAPGLMTAVVVTDAGAFDSKGDLNQDKDGKIRVHFHWDVSDTKSASCLLRVAQLMASSQAGMQFIPRVGDEVLVDFINGDIDQPIVVGSVYNGSNTPLYNQKDATQSGIKTGFAQDTSHELCFDDKKGEEKIALTSGKDLAITVANNATTLVNADDKLTIKKTQTTAIEDKQTITVTNGYGLTADKIALEGKSEIELKVGSNSIKISSSGITIDASKITLSASGDISLSGTNVKSSSTASTSIKATANLDLKATAQANLEGTAGVNVKSTAMAKVEGTAGAELSSTAMAKLTGTAMAQISGALVKIN
ncbi:type VI secretion system Vgr family protein [Thalassotalea euphylliae]|uniref:Type VI secretion system tip protein VgrG n=1 Tax=Thalassotalea euphylliae TaxID=1655234 RepID=A0A3E0U296_9GAMM|nr:type VI secretion system tip protein TssI/VgrG [Thalassotalea euphylliae]REL30717.1 type VI secretion system tip protein VgrG [Thalassotalea euphylliae]